MQSIVLPYSCQICSVLLKIDNSIERINEANLRQLSSSYTAREDIETVTALSDIELDASLSTNREASQQASQLNSDNSKLRFRPYEPMNQKSIPPRNFSNCTSMLESMQNTQSNNLVSGMHTIIESLTNMFDLVSNNSSFEHPICEECADQLLNQLDGHCKQLQKEQCEYTCLLNKIKNEKSFDQAIAELKDELTDLESEEQKLIKQLNELEVDEMKLSSDIQSVTNENKDLIAQEDKYLIEYQNSQNKLFQLEEHQSSLDNHLAHKKAHLARLTSLNVLNASFHIWHSGPFGTINYFRLGRLPDTPVEWDEINAGLGQVALLLYVLAAKIKLEFKRFKLVPFGNYSYIIALENVQKLGVKKDEKLNLYGAGGFKYYFEMDKKFDLGMVAFLDCLQQFSDKIKTINQAFAFPYPINGHKLEDTKTVSSFSIKCQFNSHEEWTKALKYMLTNLKWSLVWVAQMKE